MNTIRKWFTADLIEQHRRELAEAKSDAADKVSLYENVYQAARENLNKLLDLAQVQHKEQLEEVREQIRLVQEALAKTEQERDYFRARADRLELMVVGVPKDPQTQQRPPREINRRPIGRVPWQQQVADRIRENNEADLREAAAKQQEASARATATETGSTEETNGAKVPEPRNTKAVRSNPRGRRKEVSEVGS